MTYKYLEVRREIYEECSEKALKRFRTFKEMRTLLRTFHWILLTLMLLCCIAVILITILPISNLWGLIPAIVTAGVSIVGEFKIEKNYNKEARNKELEEHHLAYDEYINNIKNILERNGINTVSKRALLKVECNEVLDKHKKKHDNVKNRVFDILIGVPLGALISALIYQNNEAIISQIFGIIIFGCIIIFVSNFIRKVKFYSDGYFKDKHLLDALNEIEYSE